MRIWDAQVALLYAAEELFLAAQALEADVIAREDRLAVAHHHLHKLLQHEKSLPPEIGQSLRSLDASYSQRENAHAIDKAGANALITATMFVLNGVRTILAEQDRRDMRVMN